MTLLEGFDFNQVGALTLMVCLASVVREKRAVPYLLAILGSLAHGWTVLFTLCGLILVDRLITQRSKWLVLVNALGLAIFLSAWMLRDSFQPVLLVGGLLLFSIHFCRGGLGVIPALTLVHQLYPGVGPLEVILPAAGVYVLADEGLRLAKYKNKELVMAWLEPFLVLAIFYPLKEEISKWLEDPELLIWFSCFCLVMASTVMGVFVKKLTFQKWANGVYSYGQNFYSIVSKGFGERQPWVDERAPRALSVDSFFMFFFWSAISLFLVWGVVIVVMIGRRG